MKSHYPNYDVMHEIEKWDDHTREIVKKRLVHKQNSRFLTSEEKTILFSIAVILTNDDREEIISFIIKHFDQQLGSNIGESERKIGIPPESILIRNGLSAIAASSQHLYHKNFYELSIIQQQTLIGQLNRNELNENNIWDNLPQKELFLKLLTLTVEAYYSHPTIWSEIGYGGPAYPRGYVRVEPGLIDPWEAKQGEER